MVEVMVVLHTLPLPGGLSRRRVKSWRPVCVLVLVVLVLTALLAWLYDLPRNLIGRNSNMYMQWNPVNPLPTKDAYMRHELP